MADTFNENEFIIASAAFANGKVPADITLSTDNPSVAGISTANPADGTAFPAGTVAVVATAPGTTVLTAQGGGKTATVTLTVTAADNGDLIITLSDPLPKP